MRVGPKVKVDLDLDKEVVIEVDGRDKLLWVCNQQRTKSNVKLNEVIFRLKSKMKLVFH